MVRQKLAVPLLLISLMGILWYDHTKGEAAQADRIQKTALEACRKLNHSNATLADYILDQIARSEKTLPTLKYYQEHPDELANALKNLRQQKVETIHAFAPVDC